MTQRKEDLLNDIVEGLHPQEALNVILEAKGKNPGGLGHSIQNLAAIALSAKALYELFSSAFSTSKGDTFGRAFNALIGNVLVKGNAILGSKITHAVIGATGGNSQYSGQGSSVRHSFTLNTPSQDMLITRSGGGRGGHGGNESIRMPMGQPAHLARIEADPFSDGYAVNLYREDPIRGTVVGAPLKTYNMTFTGTTPGNIKKMEHDISQTIAQMGSALINNKPVYRPPIIVQRRPGRPHMREYT